LKDVEEQTLRHGSARLSDRPVSFFKDSDVFGVNAELDEEGELFFLLVACLSIGGSQMTYGTT
jgi:hypothetical protein